ncbi:MAG: glycoside hydrolase family 88 protein [Polyangiaceae bacterium]
MLLLGAALGCQPQNQAAPVTPVAEAPNPAAPAATASAPAATGRSWATLELANPSDFARPSSAVYVSYYELGISPGDHDAKILVARSGDTLLPSQIVDYDGDGAADGLLALIDFKPAETRTISIVADATDAAHEQPKRTQAEISAKSGGKWEPRKDKPNLKEYVGGNFKNLRSFSAPPEHTDHSNLIRYEGPGIESDKVAYRVYLDWRNGFDIFGKKVATPVLQQVGLDGFESYHHMADWGMDILKVGESLGVGGFGFWNKKKVELVSQVDAWDAAILENGHAYSAFRIDYKGWKIAGKKLNVRGDFSMQAGSRMVHVRLTLSDELPNLAIGVVKHPETELVLGPTSTPNGAYTYFGSWGKQSLAGDELGMAVVFQQGARKSQEVDPADYLAVVEPLGKQFDYYLLAAWQGEPQGVKSRDEFRRSLDQEAEMLSMPLRRRLKTQAMTDAQKAPLSADSALAWAKRVADSELERKALSYRYGGWDPGRKRKPHFEYDIVGFEPFAYDELGQATADPKYQSVIEKVTGSFITDKGEILEYDEKEYNIDSVLPGRNVLRLYQRTKADKYKLAAERLRRQLKQHPRTSEGAFFHKLKYPSQLWLDGVYMGMPFLAAYSTLFEKGQSYDEVVKEFTIARSHLRDEASGLYFHAWDEKKKQDWADPKTGLSKNFWGRGMGWYAMALVDVLDELPETAEKQRRPLLDLVTEVAAALAKVQDPATGTFFQVLDKPLAPGNYRESTASAMFSYFFSKSLRKKYLPETYRSVATRAFEGLTREFINVHPDGKVSMVAQCQVAGLGAGRDGSYRYYMSEPVVEDDPKGNAPFILAGIEMYRLLKGN